MGSSLTLRPNRRQCTGDQYRGQLVHHFRVILQGLDDNDFKFCRGCSRWDAVRYVSVGRIYHRQLTVHDPLNVNLTAIMPFKAQIIKAFPLRYANLSFTSSFSGGIIQLKDGRAVGFVSGVAMALPSRIVSPAMIPNMPSRHCFTSNSNRKSKFDLTMPGIGFGC